MDGDHSLDVTDDVGQTSVTERLRQREEERLSKLLKSNKNEMQKEKKEFENDFQRALTDVKQKINSLDEVAADKNILLKSFEAVRDVLQNLHKMVAEAASFLTTYEKRVANETLNSLQQEVSSKEDCLLPKKKFTFKTRKKESDKPLVVEKMKQPSASVSSSQSMTMSISLSDMEGQVLSKQAEDVNGKDVEISRLSNCTVYIYGSPSTVFITSLKKCNIYLGPVSTSVFVEGCEHGNFTLACQQLRVHSSRGISFFVHITSRSIIEECQGIRFAKLNWHYDQLDEHFKASGLDQKVNNWMLVDDFNWLSADVPSPNWSLIDSTENAIKQNE